MLATLREERSSSDAMRRLVRRSFVGGLNASLRP
jgi:hypothetical protein